MFKTLYRTALIILVIIPIMTSIVTPMIYQDTLFDFFPLPTYLNLHYNFTLIMFFAIFVFWVILLILCWVLPKKVVVSHRNWILFAGTIIGIPMCFVYSVLALSGPEMITNSVEFGNHRYHLTLQYQFGDRLSSYYIYQCDVNDTRCEKVYTYVASPLLLSTNLVVDPERQEIQYYSYWSSSCELIATIVPQLKEYKLESYEEFDNAWFEVISTKLDLTYEVILTTSTYADTGNNTRTISCKILPFRYVTNSFEQAKLQRNELINGIELFIDDQLVLTYDNVLHCHVDGCIILDR